MITHYSKPQKTLDRGKYILKVNKYDPLSYLASCVRKA